MCVCYGGMKKNKSLFISRDVKPESVFLQLLHAKGYQVSGQSLIAFEPIDFSAYPATDWIFFYSARAAEYFSLGLEKLAHSWPSAAKVAAMGRGTARWLQAQERQVDFIGSGHPAAVVAHFAPLIQGQTVLFPRAKNSKQSIQRLLPPQLETLDLVVYQNEPKAQFSIPPVDILVFTSPMNAKTYFQKYAIAKDQQLISIGASTSQALVELGHPQVIEAQEPSEKGLAQAVFRLAQTGPL